MAIYGILKEDTPFNDIFPDGKVPLAAIDTISPVIADTPRLYLVEAKALNLEQTLKLGILTFKMHGERFSSLDEAIEAVKKDFGMDCKWFICSFVNELRDYLMLVEDNLELDEPCEFDEDEFTASSNRDAAESEDGFKKK